MFDSYFINTCYTKSLSLDSKSCKYSVALNYTRLFDISKDSTKITRYAVYYKITLYYVVKCECGNRKVEDPRSKHLEEILLLKWCPNCRRRGYCRSLSDDEAR